MCRMLGKILYVIEQAILETDKAQTLSAIQLPNILFADHYLWTFRD